jgi:hypothetical protein
MRAAASRRLAASLACGALLLAFAPPCRGLSGAEFSIPVSEINTGGVKALGASFLNFSAIGGRVTPMNGGPYALTPGPAGSLKPAAPDVEEAHCYPSAFIPSTGHNKIVFSKLAPDVTIEVFTVSGRLVKRLTKNDSTDFYNWTPANELGAALASGVYVYTVHAADGSRKQGKFVVVR